MKDGPRRLLTQQFVVTCPPGAGEGTRTEEMASMLQAKNKEKKPVKVPGDLESEQPASKLNRVFSNHPYAQQPLAGMFSVGKLLTRARPGPSPSACGVSSCD